MTIKADAQGHISIDWSKTPIIIAYGRKGMGKSVFLESCLGTIFKRKENGKIVNTKRIKVIDLWNASAIGRFEGVYMAYRAKKKYAIARAKNGMQSFGIPVRVLIPNSLDVPSRLPMNPKEFVKNKKLMKKLMKNKKVARMLLKNKGFTKEQLNNKEFVEKILKNKKTMNEFKKELKKIDLDFRKVTIPYRQLTGAELCMRYGRRETELVMSIIDRVIRYMNPDESPLHLANELKNFLSGKSRTTITGLESKGLDRFLRKEIADMRSRRGVIALIKPLIEEEMLARENFEYNLNWEKEIKDVNRISVLYQGWLDYGTSLMITFWSMRKIIEVCKEKGCKVIFLIREVSDIAPQCPNPLYPQQAYGAYLMEQIARQLRGRVALLCDTQRPHLLIPSLKTQSDVNVYFGLQGQDMRDANRSLSSVVNMDFEKGKGKWPPLHKLEIGQCYVHDTETNQVKFFRKVYMPPFMHWEGGRSVLLRLKDWGYPTKSDIKMKNAIKKEVRKADQEICEDERKWKEIEEREVTKMMKEGEIEERTNRERVLYLSEKVDPNTGAFYTERAILRKMNREGYEITRYMVGEILKEAGKKVV